MTKYFKYNYQDAHLLKFMLLPNKDLKLYIELDLIMNPNGPIKAEITFYNIQNFDLIKQQFLNFKNMSKDILDMLHSISKTTDDSYLIEFFNNKNLTIMSKSNDFKKAVYEI